ncbi:MULTISPECIES: cysteine hydrolase family protein [unclassified Inquilinus]|uniref:cysteine hydrolase family protein n=1 Tax=unclassified Inquilinus TaxID=2645927 RepID=UPI003F925CAB
MTVFIPTEPPEVLGARFRERAVDLRRTAVISVDMQNADCAAKKRHGPVPEGAAGDGYRYFYDRLDRVVIPNQQRLHAATRALGIENIYVIIESLTLDGRDRGLDHRISLIHNPRGSWEAQVIDEVAPAGDDIIIRKTASGPFGTTNLDYVLKALGIDHLIVFGVLTDQCVENTVRVGGDLGYLVTMVDDASATYSQVRHDHALSAFKGYCRIRSTDALLAELDALARIRSGS